MQLGVNVPNFGPGTDRGVLHAWAQTVEGLGFDLLMVSDHVAITDDVAAQYPAPFYEPFTTLSWMAGITTRVRLGTTVLIVPYRQPLLTARMAANLNDLSGGRLVLGVGVGWARGEFAALGVPFERRGALTDAYLGTMRRAWKDTSDYRGGDIPIWIGGNSDAAIHRAVRTGDPWHPLRFTMDWLRSRTIEAPALAPRIAFRVTQAPVLGADRLAGVGTLEQVVDDLRELERMGATTVVLDPFHGDPGETERPEVAWNALAAIAAAWHVAHEGARG